MNGYFSPKTRPKLGDRILAQNTIVKTREPISDVPLRYGTFQAHRTIWMPQIGGVDGIFIGYRTLAEGETNLDGDPDVDGGIAFYPKRRFEAWLVVIHPRHNPVYVLPEWVFSVNGHNPAEHRYFKRRDGDGIASISDGSAVGSYYNDIVWDEIAYSEYTELSKAMEAKRR